MIGVILKPRKVRGQGTSWIPRRTLVICCIWAVLSCGRAVDPPNFDTVGKLYIADRSTSNRNSSIEQVEVYLDASIPMQNFIDERGGAHKTLYTRILEFMGGDPWIIGNVRYYRFGEGGPSPISAQRGLTVPAKERSFYDQKWTHLGELVAGFHRQLDSGDRTVKVVVTDLVQANEPSPSEPSQSNWVFLANQIRECQRVGGWQFIAFRSRYQGKHYPESGGQPFPVDTPVDRPFYIMVFGPSEEAAEKASSSLLEGEGTKDWRALAHRFRPKMQMGRIRWLKEDIPDFIEVPVRRRNRVLPHGDIFEGQILEVQWNKIVNQRDRAPLKFLLGFETDAPEESFTDIQNPGISLEFTCFRWSGPNTDRAVALADTMAVDFEGFRLTRPAYDTIPGIYKRDYWMECRVRPSDSMRSGQFYVHRFSLRASPKELHLPPWCNDWSTDDDNEPSQIGRTLNLKRVLGNIVRTTSIDNPLFTGFLIVHGR